MIYESHDATTAGRPRLLPWSNLAGNPCYLVTDDTGTGRLPHLADDIEAVEPGMADDLLGHAVDLLGDAKVTAPGIRYLAARLTEALPRRAPRGPQQGSASPRAPRR